MVLHKIAANTYTLAVGCYVQFLEPPTNVFWQRRGKEAGTALCFACHCAALYVDCISCLCCRLLLCSCRSHLVAGAPVHHHEILWTLFLCLWICFQGNKQMYSHADRTDMGKRTSWLRKDWGKTFKFYVFLYTFESTGMSCMFLR